MKEVTVAWHFCASHFHEGPRWLRSVYFYRHSRHKSGLQSYCMTCTKIKMRKQNLSEETRIKRNEYSRRYKARQRRAAGVPVRNLKNPTFDHLKLHTWLVRLLVSTSVDTSKGKSKQWYLNGKPLERADSEFIRHLRNGHQERVSLQRVDSLAVKYDLPLWEVEEFASRYKLDKRTKRRRKLNQHRASAQSS